MRDKDRLIELKIQFVENFNCGNCKPEESKCKKCLTEKEADYLLANGVIVPPCKSGDTIYKINKIPNSVIEPFITKEKVEPYAIIYENIMGGYSCIPFDRFGEDVFLTKEEAEAELRKRSNDNG